MKIYCIQASLLLIIAMSLGTVLLSCFGCAVILNEKIEIIGVAKLSDNPPQGFGGIKVSNGYLETMTDIDGRFKLEGKIIGDASFRIMITMQDYNERSIDVNIDYASDSKPTDSDADTVIDLGTITLTKIGTI